MIELMEITQQMLSISKRLDQASRVLHKMAAEKAESERIYRMRLAQEILKLKAEGMSATLIPDIARGNVSDLLFQRDAAEARFKAAMESLEALKSQLSALQSILKYMEAV